jgi:DNA-binding NtrC family response regulator
MKRILIIDDDRASLSLLRELFKSQGWEAETAQTPQQALELASRGKFDLLLSDINLEAEMSGIDLLQQLRGTRPVILMTGYGTLDTAVAAAREGAWDIIAKPIKPKELLVMAGRALESRSRAVEEPEPYDAPDSGQAMIGRSPVMLELYKQIARVAPSRSTVLIVGESGTGKELIARSIHEHGEHANGPFVPVNCGALTETLLEAELFGYMKGSFTGAAADRKGLWEEAGGGTLFLDEIGETSQAMQVKLLRALQEKEIRRVGSTKNIKVDARVVAATNRDLEKEVEAKTFREDLFYRLCVVTLQAPALRQRRSDIPLLAERFLRSAAENARRGALKLSEDTIKTLASYEWPGNVRELESAIEYAALQSRGAEITPADLPPKLQSAEVREAAQRLPMTALFDDLPTLDELERRYLLHVLEIAGGSRTNAAKIMGIDRRTLYRMAERFKINLADSENENAGE